MASPPRAACCSAPVRRFVDPVDSSLVFLLVSCCPETLIGFGSGCLDTPAVEQTMGASALPACLTALGHTVLGRLRGHTSW